MIIDVSESHRLPKHFRPIHYDLKIATDLVALKFHGTVSIKLDIVEEASTITLNALDLDLFDVEVIFDEQDQVFLPILQSVDKVSERATFVFPVVFSVGSEIILRLSFSAQLAEHLEGYHKSAWSKDGKSTAYAVSQLAVGCYAQYLKYVRG